MYAHPPPDDFLPGVKTKDAFLRKMIHIYAFHTGAHTGNKFQISSQVDEVLIYDKAAVDDNTLIRKDNILKLSGVTEDIEFAFVTRMLQCVQQIFVGFGGKKYPHYYSIVITKVVKLWK